MRISDWSSDVCSSDLVMDKLNLANDAGFLGSDVISGRPEGMDDAAWRHQREVLAISQLHANVDAEIPDRKRVVSGKSVSVRVDLGGRRLIKKQRTTQ